MKQVKKSILFFLAFNQRFLIGNRPQNELVSYRYFYDRLNYFSASSIRGAAIDLVKKGLLEKFWRGRISFFRLTSLGKEMTHQLWPVLFAKTIQINRAKTEFYVAVYRVCKDKPNLNHQQDRQKGIERQLARRSLKKVLLNLGFRSLGRGVYINFRPIKTKIDQELLKNDLWDQVLVFKATDFVWRDQQQVIFQTWAGAAIQKEAEQFITQTRELLERLKTNKSLSGQLKNRFSRQSRDWFCLLQSWPKQVSGSISLNQALSVALRLTIKLNQAWERLSLVDTV
ncbi:hypothetical protein KKD62_00115 [Patescibacteria group bacterium]|nr:hypothetical protein [Patescibacteria group bacterium]MBU1931381.1 hypothetical protein [Patescibacteria group bacterium]